MRRQQLQDARKQKGLSIAEISRQADISKRHYCYIESGERTGSLPVIKKIAEILGIKDINLF